MRIIGEAGLFLTPASGTPNDWVIHLESNDLSVGTYSIPFGRPG